MNELLPRGSHFYQYFIILAKKVKINAASKRKNVAVEDGNQLDTEKSKYAAGDEVELKVYKGVSGKIEKVKIKLA